MSRLIRRLLQELEEKMNDNEPAAGPSVQPANETGNDVGGTNSQPRSATLRDEYSRLFQPYRFRPIPAFRSATTAIPPAKRPRKVIGQKLWRHNFVFLKHPQTTLVPDARERAQLMADGLGETKLEFQEGLGPAHVHEVLCKQHPDIANTGYELCWVQSGSRLLEVISSPPRGFTVDFLKTFLNHSKCYIRPIQGSMKSVEYSDKENIDGDIPRTKCSSCNAEFPIHKLKEHREQCSQDGRDGASLQYLDDSSEDSSDEELQEALRLSRIYTRAAAANKSEAGSSSSLRQLKDLEEVGKVVRRRLKSGKRNLMLISGDSILEDTLHYMVRFMGEQGIDCGGPLREYFRLLREETKQWFHGSNQYLLPISSAAAIQDRRFIYLGWIITLSLALNGCAFDYLSPTIYNCLSAESLEQLSIPVEELPPDRRGLVEKVQDAQTTEELIKVFREDDHATFLLYETGSFKKPILLSDISDKPVMIRELKDGVLYSCWAAILQLQQGLRNLDVLSIIKTNSEIMKDFFCFKPPNLTSTLFSSLFQPQFSSLRAVREKEEEAYGHFLDFLEECGNCSTPGDEPLPLRDILSFATGADEIPPCGFHPSPSLLFYDGSLPLASTCSNELTIPTTHTTYYEFSNAFVEGVVGSGGLFGQP